jgi:hypothetical protein
MPSLNLISSLFPSSSGIYLKKMKDEQKEVEEGAYKDLLQTFPDRFQKDLKQKRITPRQPEHLFPYVLSFYLANPAEADVVELRKRTQGNTPSPLMGSELEDVYVKSMAFIKEHAYTLPNTAKFPLKQVPTSFILTGFHDAVREYGAELEKEKNIPEDSWDQEESGSTKALKRIVRYTEILLKQQEYDEIGCLLRTPGIGDNSEIVAGMC